MREIARMGGCGFHAVWLAPGLVGYGASCHRHRYWAARKLIKTIGQELAETAEFAPLIIELLKMQGVEMFDDYSIKIRLKMMTMPGEQFVTRRKAYAMIKKAFDENGIKFAFPIVRVAGSEEPRPASRRRRSRCCSKSSRCEM